MYHVLDTHRCDIIYVERIYKIKNTFLVNSFNAAGWERKM